MLIFFVTKKKQSKLKIFIEDLRSCVQAFIQSLFSAAVILPKIQFFYSLLSSLSPWSIPRVDSERKIFKIEDSKLPENAFPTLFLTAEA